MVNHCYNRTTIDMNDIKVNLTEIYLNHPGAFEEWLLSEVNEDLIKKIAEIKSREKEPSNTGEKGEANGAEEEKHIRDDARTRSQKVERNNSVTSELFQVWVSSPKNTKSQNGARPERRKETQSMDEGDFFMDLIRDVATELDIDVLCHKILINVCLLTYADRGSLFLARGPPEKRYLVAKLFDVTVDTEFEEAIQKVKHEDLRIPFGVGIVGYVAQSKEIINIKDAYNDPRFNSEIDMRTGYKTNLILSMPICNYEGDVIGVAQIINKTNGSQEFTKRDVEVFQRYLTFGGIGIQNAQLFELSVQEYKRNQILLHLARSIFEEQSNLECLVTKIMREARDLLKCERCAVYLLDLESCSEESCVVSPEKTNADYDSSDESLFQELGTRQQPFILMEKMIDETRTMILGILRGDLSDEIKKQIESTGVDFTGSYSGVSKVIKKCLRKAKNRKEGKELVTKCFERVVRERQTETPEETDGPSTVQSCIQNAMIDASQSAAPLMMEAQEHAALFREMVQKTASGLANCRAHESPFQCMMGVWAEAQQNMTFMRDQVIDMMLIARDIYVQYTDDVRKCITPVEAIDGEEEPEVEEEEEDEGDLIEEEETKKATTPTTPPKVTPTFYDPVEEAKRKVFLKHPQSAHNSAVKENPLSQKKPVVQKEEERSPEDGINHLEHIIQQPNKKTQERQPLSRRQSNNINVDDIFQTGELISSIRFSTIFELRADETDAIVLKPKTGEMSESKLVQIAKYVAANGQILNISDVTAWMSQDVREDDNFLTKSILCMPISNGQKTLIGVAQLINKTNQQPFTDSDVSIFEAFAIFCGLGIHNTQMYENACKLMAKQKVALECLSYHASASVEDTDRLYNDAIPSVDTYNLLSFKFIDFKLADEDTCRATIRMFMECNLINHFQIPYNVLCRWVLSVKKNYRPVKYHNWRHALNVAQTMFAMLKTGKMERFMTDLEILGLLVACLCHDLDHRGTNNAFQTKTESPLAILYTTSTMEHHHFDQCVMILNSEGNNIFQALSPDDYRQVMKVVENAILSTDLAMYFKKKNRFRELVDDGEFDWQCEEKKEILCGMMMTACDVSAISKPWEVQHKMAKLVADEFFDQGDLEKLQLNQQPVAMMDRERKDELPQMQVGFIDVICLPLYKVMSDTFPWIRPLYEGCLENRNHWQDLAEKVEMGLTWIDHDTIDKPVEEFAANADEQPQDIEFTVTTLNCSHSLERQSTTESENGATALELPRKVSTVGIALGRFASLRKVKGRTTQNRQSRSFYSRTKGSKENSPKKAEPTTPDDEHAAGQTKQHKAVAEHSAKQQKRKKLCTLF